MIESDYPNPIVGRVYTTPVTFFGRIVHLPKFYLTKNFLGEFQKYKDLFPEQEFTFLSGVYEFPHTYFIIHKNTDECILLHASYTTEKYDEVLKQNVFTFHINVITYEKSYTNFKNKL